MPLSEEDCDVTYKVLVLGDDRVGKSALLDNLMGRPFRNEMFPTIGVDFVRKIFEVDGALIQLGLILVYDITNEMTFETLKYWIRSIQDEIIRPNGSYEPIPMILCGNKSDLLKERRVSTARGQKMMSYHPHLIRPIREKDSRTKQPIKLRQFKTKTRFRLRNKKSPKDSSNQEERTSCASRVLHIEGDNSNHLHESKQLDYLPCDLSNGHSNNNPPLDCVTTNNKNKKKHKMKRHGSNSKDSKPKASKFKRTFSCFCLKPRRREISDVQS
ncbi:ras-related protein rab-10 [Plakobranchus ocellatus]|uniref:Ras-related protein rab-10 n=1 Tax=Plakobranchus ocellatus TaxID=259542 RepID=A0AAV4D8X8_9GAST|nr:ras-related protein rab-10 [Plakobranchus ocellatus]